MKRPARHVWTADSITTLRNLYPNTASDVVAKVIGCSLKAVYYKAHSEGLHKTPAFMASDASGRVQRGKQHPRMLESQFKPGMAPWNKGIPWIAGGKSHTTRFKPGRPPSSARNYQPIGTLRTSRDGYLERKTNDTHPMPVRRWVAVHRLVWEEANGPIPARHIVVFKPGTRTAVEAEITADKLECITRAENARRNHPKNKSPELARLVQLKGAITRQVNRINREHAEQQGQTA